MGEGGGEVQDKKLRSGTENEGKGKRQKMEEKVYSKISKRKK